MTPDSVESRLARIEERLDAACQLLRQLSDRLDQHYVTREEFEPVQRIVYGLVGLVLLTVMGCLLKGSL